MKSFEFLLLALALGVVGVVGGRILVRGFLGFVGVGLQRRSPCRAMRASDAPISQRRAGRASRRRACRVRRRPCLRHRGARGRRIDARRSAASSRSAARAPASRPRLRAAPRRGRGPRRRGSCDTVVEHRGQIRGDAFHPPRPDRLDPRLLDRVEQRARRLVLRRMAAMDRVVVAGEPQRHRIGEPRRIAASRGLGLRGGSGSRALRAVGADDQRGLVGGEQRFRARDAATSRECTRRAPA